MNYSMSGLNYGGSG